jgi:hypothetical protein
MTPDPASDDLAARVAEFGPHPFLITSMPDGAPHVVSVVARLDDGRVWVNAGRTSRANVEAGPAATLLWPAPPGGDYSLILDGQATVIDAGPGEISLHPTRAVLHRVAGAGANLPSCVQILPTG